MQSRGFAILAAATVIVVGAAVAAVVVDTRLPTTVREGEVAFPKLQKRVNDVAEITIVNRDQKIVIAKGDKGWVLPQKHNYPAQTEKVRELVNGLEDLKLIEAKTNRPERFNRLDLDDPTGKEANSAHVTLKAANGDVLADGVIGKRKYDMSSTGIAGTYVRLGKDNQAWLGRGELDPGKQERLWLQRKLTDVKKERVRRYTITHADGEKVVASRETAKDENFKAESLQGGQQMKNKAAADSPATTLAFFEFDDVKPAAGVNLPEKPLARTEFVTFDGLVVTVDVYEIDNDKWAKIVAREGEVVAPPPAEPKKDEKPAAATTPPPKTVPVPQEIQTINATTGAWLYKLPEFAVKNLTTRNAAFLPEKPAS